MCGLALCKKCSNKELLLYIEDGQAEGRRTQSKLGIIKFVGVSIYQYVAITDVKTTKAGPHSAIGRAPDS